MLEYYFPSIIVLCFNREIVNDMEHQLNIHDMAKLLSENAKELYENSRRQVKVRNITYTCEHVPLGKQNASHCVDMKNS